MVEDEILNLTMVHHNQEHKPHSAMSPTSIASKATPQQPPPSPAPSTPTPMAAISSTRFPPTPSHSLPLPPAHDTVPVTSTLDPTSEISRISTPLTQSRFLPPCPSTSVAPRGRPRPLPLIGPRAPTPPVGVPQKIRPQTPTARTRAMTA